KKYGCCNFRTKTIRISHILAEMPEWVRDYVVVHEMAHLIEPNHSKAFWDIAHRYKLAERARGYLMAKGMKTD
ncbi:M48 family metallopeptidase, partial [bacterium]|nr:M48 family metallopeptidase [bacterium]